MDNGKDVSAMHLASSLPSPLKELILAVKSDGWGPLFAGIGPTLSATAISQGVYFWLYSKLRQATASNLLLGDGGGRFADIGVVGSTLVASLAGCGNVLVTTPAWVLATQMMAKEKSSDPEEKRLSLSQVAHRLYADGGISGLWRGLLPSLVMVLNPTIQFVLYERLVSRLLSSRGSNKGLTTGDVFLLTAVAKLGSTLVTYPLLLIKSRLQAASKGSSVTQYTGVINALKLILREEGVRGLFKGLRMKILQTILTAALLMSIKERVYKVLIALKTKVPKSTPAKML